MTTANSTVDAGDMQDAIFMVYKLFATAGVFSMQIGFAFLEGGFVHYGSVNVQLLKNILDLCIAGVLWVFAGQYIAGYDDLDAMDWIFQWSFAITAGTIISGSIAGRITPYAYAFSAAIITGGFYPLVVRMFWNAEVDPTPVEKFHDFAGSGVVHLFGGASALAGVIFVGPHPMYDPAKNSQPHNVPMIVLGAMLLYVGWFSFNAGSMTKTQLFVDPMLVGTILRNTAMGGAFGGFTSYILTSCRPKCQSRCQGGLQENISNLPATLNGCLAGLVAVTACCDVLNMYEASAVAAIGAVACWLCSSALKLAVLNKAVKAPEGQVEAPEGQVPPPMEEPPMEDPPMSFYRRRKDLVQNWWFEDTVDAVAVHGAAGLVGLVAPCIFNQTDLELADQVVGGLIIMGIGFFGASMVFCFLRCIQDVDCCSQSIGQCWCCKMTTSPDDFEFGCDEPETGMAAYFFVDANRIVDIPGLAQLLRPALDKLAIAKTS